MTIGEKVNQAIANLGENISIRRFAPLQGRAEVPNQVGTPASRPGLSAGSTPNLAANCCRPKRPGLRGVLLL